MIANFTGPCHSFRNMARAARLACCSLLALMLISCGGGGGSSGKSTSGSSSTDSTGSTTATTIKAHAIAVLFSSPTLPSAGTAATAVTVTAQVSDANNNALGGVPVTFTADSGLLAVTLATSSSSGIATATLNTAGNQTNRVINITATGGGVTGKGTINVTGTTVRASSAPTALTINTLSRFTFNLQDSGGNNIVNVPVTFSATAGNTVAPDPLDAGTAAAPVTDSNGNVTFDITPTAGGSGTLSVSAEGASATAAFTTTSQSLSVTLTDPTTSPATVVSVSPQPIPEYTSTSCIQVDSAYAVNGTPTAGTALVTTSRGVLYTDKVCSIPLSAASVPFTAGKMQTLYLSSLTAGTATVAVSEMSGTVAGPTQSASVTFIAQLNSAVLPNITLTAFPDIVAANTNSVNPTAQFSVLTATVRDGTTNNNLVQGVPVKFTLVTDSSGGYISPAVVTTQANGQAQANYYPGAGTTAQNGVKVLAAIQSTVATNSTQISLTVAGQALFVTAGTGNTVDSTETTYSQVWSVFVTDSAGNPVQGATVDGQLVATSYTKGNMKFDSGWIIDPSTQPVDGFNLAGTASGPWCPNTDIANDGVWSPINPPPAWQIYYPSVYPLDPSLEGTVYQHLMPGIPGNVTSSGVTDASGHATLTLTYPKDHAIWTNAELTVHASTLGTQSSASASINPLQGAAADYASQTVSPPGFYSPYGVNNCVTAF
ncbi:MAG: hypothetical protein ACHP7O_00795 [Burkholderiales bacterium]